ncbi:MAG: BNR-4 repeat-containing protein [Verrucomicrobia bacterium]|nr:BNR-4 repeat-containing protein [Verrucomicrobiota bacterium]
MPRWKDKAKLNTGEFQVNLELDAPASSYRAEWIEPATGKVLLAETKQHAGGALPLSSPHYAQDVALRLTAATDRVIASAKDDGYRGIWFTLGQKSEFGDKYSGGLGTYTANHVPMAIYSKEADKTFFVYGGAKQGKRHLLAMASYYDHRRGVVPRPTIVHDKQGVDDPHDNPSLAMDGKGHLWVFVSGRAKKRPGIIYRSTKPYSTDEFEQVGQREFTYPQPRWFEGRGFLFLFTKYTKGRELYFNTSPDGRNWTPDVKFAGMGGHYQTSHVRGNRVITAFNMHPGGNVDKRTNLYFLQTDDFGKTWRNVRGEPVELPLADPKNPALVHDYQAGQRNVYIHDLDLDRNGRPVILFITSAGHQPGPGGDPRWWTVAHWLGDKWKFTQVTRANHNYSTGSLYIEADAWRIIGPTERGPQPVGSGGEVGVWASRDAGKTWSKERDVTRGSARNHNYVRRPVNAHPGFYAFWADGNPDELSPSKLYFTNKAGDKVWQLPDAMSGGGSAPAELNR